jgi:hypothetical protein
MLLLLLPDAVCCCSVSPARIACLDMNLQKARLQMGVQVRRWFCAGLTQALHNSGTILGSRNLWLRHCGKFSLRALSSLILKFW